MATIPYDKLDILGDTSTVCEKIFHHSVASALFPTRSAIRSASYDTWSSSQLSMV